MYFYVIFMCFELILRRPQALGVQKLIRLKVVVTTHDNDPKCQSGALVHRALKILQRRGIPTHCGTVAHRGGVWVREPQP